MLFPDRLANNAYRTLGLTAGASQEEIDQAARRMRIWPDAQSVPDTPNDLPWLGPVPRSRVDIEQAYARLMDPVARVEERLLWLHQPAELNGPEGLQHQINDLASRPGPASHHDAAILRAHAVIHGDPGLLDLQSWRDALLATDDVSRSDEYRQAIDDIERGGKFEKCPSAAEIEAALRNLPDGLVRILVRRADHALDQNDFDVCARINTVLADEAISAGPLQELLKDSRHHLLDRLEDLIDRRCRLTIDEISRKIVCDRKRFSVDKNIASNRAACRPIGRDFARQVEPLIPLLEDLFGYDGLRLQRVRIAVAGAMRKLGLAWVWSGEYSSAHRIFQAGISLAWGTPLAELIIKDRTQNFSRANRLGNQSTSLIRPLVAIAAVVLFITLFSLVSHVGHNEPAEPLSVPQVPIDPLRDPKVQEGLEVLRALEIHKQRLSAQTQPDGFVGRAPDPLNAQDRRALEILKSLEERDRNNHAQTQPSTSTAPTD